MKDPLSQFDDSLNARKGQGSSPVDPLQQLPRRRFSLNKNIWLPIVIMVVLVVPLAWFGGKRVWDAYTFRRWLSKNTNELQENLNAYTRNGRYDFSDQKALRAYTDLLGWSVDDVKYIIQLNRVNALRGAIIDYRTLHGVFPDTIELLANAYDSLIAGCKEQKVTCTLNSLAQPLEDIAIVDIYTDKTFPYEKKGDDFTLAYRMGGCNKSCSKNLSELFVKGRNTMTSGDFSLEKPHTSDYGVGNTTNGSNGAATNQLTNAAATAGDSDGDGLTDTLETTLYMTKPTKKDTDGDGYDDGNEIIHGYNPLGAGSTTAAQRTAWTTPISGGSAFTAGDATSRWDGDSATVSWITSKESTSVVEYGTTNAYGTRIDKGPASTIHHQFTATSSTNLYYGIWSCTPTPDPACAYLDGVATYPTPPTTPPTNDATPPVISNVSATQRASDSYVVVRWTTNKRTNGYVQFGMDASYQEQSRDYSQSETDHWAEVFPGYASGTYHYKITVCEPYPNDKVCASTEDRTLPIKYSQ
ncbi:MAG: hypothetical protein V1907_00840 [Candidatus Kerfeldbacteria bacterium]